MAVPEKFQALAAKAEAALTAVAAKLASRQATYRSAKGRYWQGMRVPAEVPVDGVAKPVDTARKPSRQAEDWSAMSLGADLPASLDYSLQVDVYDGPQGVGYTVAVLLELEGTLFRRVVNVGPEGHRTRNWQRVMRPRQKGAK